MYISIFTELTNIPLEVLWLLPYGELCSTQTDRSKTSDSEWLIHNSMLLHSANSEYLLILGHSLLCWIMPTDIMRKSQVLGSGWLNWWPEARKLGDYGWAIIITTYGLPESWSAAPAGAYLHTGSSEHQSTSGSCAGVRWHGLQEDIYPMWPSK